MSQELTRNFNVLKEKADPPAYFLSYEVAESEYHNITGSLGAIDSNSSDKGRTLDVSVRAGSPRLDNYHRVRGAGAGQASSGAQITYEDSVNSIKQRLWLETDRAYRTAAERLIRIRTNTQVKVAESDNSADFSRSRLRLPSKHPPAQVRSGGNGPGACAALGALRNYPRVLTSRVSASCQVETNYLVNTEGTRLVHGRGFARVVSRPRAKAADGTDLEHLRDVRSGGCRRASG